MLDKNHSTELAITIAILSNINNKLEHRQGNYDDWQQESE